MRGYLNTVQDESLNGSLTRFTTFPFVARMTMATVHRSSILFMGNIDARHLEKWYKFRLPVKDYSCYSFKNFIYFNLFFTDFTLTRKYFDSDAPEVILQYQMYLSSLLK